MDTVTDTTPLGMQTTGTPTTAAEKKKPTIKTVILPDDACKLLEERDPIGALIGEVGEEAEVVEPTADGVDLASVQNLHTTDEEPPTTPAPEPEDEVAVVGPEERAEWKALKAACPLWGVGTVLLGHVPVSVRDAMALRRKSRGDELVVDLLAWAPIYRAAAEEKKGKKVEEASGYGRSRLALGVRMLEAVEANGGVIPAAWLGLGPDGVDELLRKKPTPKEKVTPTPKLKPSKFDPPTWAEGTKRVIAVLDDREVRDALRADEKSAKALASGLATAAIRAICLLEPKAAKRALRQLAKEADARRAFAVPPFETKPKMGEADTPEGGSVIDLFAGGDDDNEAASLSHPPEFSRPSAPGSLQQRPHPNGASR